MATSKTAAAKKSRRKASTSSPRRPPRPTRKWSKRVTETSDAMDLAPAVFKQRSARAIASSLKRSAECSKRRKSGAYQSAISMLTFYINRAGKNLTASRRKTLENAKDELRALFGREE